MKYQALYDAATAKDGQVLFVRVADNVIPFDGWFVQESGWRIVTKDIFDSAVDIITAEATYGGGGYIAVANNGQCRMVSGKLFGSHRKEYAMGYAHGAGLEGIYDVGTGKLVKRK